MVFSITVHELCIAPKSFETVFDIAKFNDHVVPSVLDRVPVTFAKLSGFKDERICAQIDYIF